MIVLENIQSLNLDNLDWFVIAIRPDEVHVEPLKYFCFHCCWPCLGIIKGIAHSNGENQGIKPWAGTLE